jgi:hypothetical protein
MKQYNPDSSWQKGEDQQEETAGEPKTGGNGGDRR